MRLQHVSIAIPRGGEEQARAFYGGLLGLSDAELGRLREDGVV